MSVAAKCFSYLPGRNLDVTTFEIKKTIGEGIIGIYETAAHSAFAHRSFLLVQVGALLSAEDSADLYRVTSESKRFGLGVITFTDASDWNTYQTLVDAELSSPSPAQINKFVGSQISEAGRQRLLKMFR